MTMQLVPINYGYPMPMPIFYEASLSPPIVSMDFQYGFPQPIFYDAPQSPATSTDAQYSYSSPFSYGSASPSSGTSTDFECCSRIELPRWQIGPLIGTGGANIQDLRRLTRTIVVVDNKNHEKDLCETVIRGSALGVQTVETFIEKLASRLVGKDVCIEDLHSIKPANPKPKVGRFDVVNMLAESLSDVLFADEKQV